MKADETSVVYTVGHSNRRLDDFIKLLSGAGVETLVDVRRHPVSNRFPQFSGDALRGSLEIKGITYHWAGRHLGGRREPVATSAHIALEDEGMRAYADYMGTDTFARAATQLLRLASRQATAIMCAERNPADCHRSLIADYLVLRGWRVRHLIAPGQHVDHRLDPRARRESHELVYDRLVNAQLWE